MIKETFYVKYMKRFLDIIICLIIFVILLPVFFAIYFVIRLESKGNGLFKQERIGKHGKVFEIYKFRTMVPNAEKIGDGLFIKSDTDTRITKVGNILRKTSLDELPQLINIIKGDMSIVGPRPPVTYYPYQGYENYPLEAKRRFDVKPGLTGLAQIKYRNSASWEEKIIVDIEYVKNVSFKLDTEIIFSTVWHVLKSEDIYRNY
ncbi:sugar transferase [Vagococcus sp. CY53-2]|uniref:sugar transferase n=1 Tax=Vagococcus sp. CY53-2 TaxID=2925780 RepID=UPI001F512F4B|nr:sugar transferase [Vagococcus sp. CY53-2]MCI0130537.1 sugar transferase [Vagococcus sp. CY53-2]